MSAWRLKRPQHLPSPQPTEEALPFFEALQQGELKLQQCSRCERWSHPPRAMCPQCQSFDFQWLPVSGRGTVYSYVVTHQAVHPALVDHTPFATVEVELEEGPRITSNLIDVPPEEIEIGTAVEVVFEKISDEVTLPLFRRA
ncbi:MAG: Zn-ribbon domain-containing OB-fold protein [Pseudomonadales bacterium]